MRKSLFHKHIWKEVSRSFQHPAKNISIPPMEGPVSAVERAVDQLMSLAEGQTFVQLRCQECGDLATRTLRGVHDFVRPVA